MFIISKIVRGKRMLDMLRQITWEEKEAAAAAAAAAVAAEGDDAGRRLEQRLLMAATTIGYDFDEESDDEEQEHNGELGAIAAAVAFDDGGRRRRAPPPPMISHHLSTKRTAVTESRPVRARRPRSSTHASRTGVVRKMSHLTKQMSLEVLVRKCSLRDWRQRLGDRMRSFGGAGSSSSDECSTPVTGGGLQVGTPPARLAVRRKISDGQEPRRRKRSANKPKDETNGDRRRSSRRRAQAGMRRSSSLPSISDYVGRQMAPELQKLIPFHRRAIRFTWKRMKANKNGRRLETVVEDVFEKIVRKQPVMKDMFFTKSFLSALGGDRREILTIRDHAKCVIRLIDQLMIELEQFDTAVANGAAANAINNGDVATLKKPSVPSPTVVPTTDIGTALCPKAIGLAHRNLKAFGFTSSFWEAFGEALVDEFFKQEAVRDMPGAPGAWVSFTATLTDMLRAGFESSNRAAWGNKARQQSQPKRSQPTPPQLSPTSPSHTTTTIVRQQCYENSEEPSSPGSVACRLQQQQRAWSQGSGSGGGGSSQLLSVEMGGGGEHASPKGSPKKESAGGGGSPPRLRSVSSGPRVDQPQRQRSTAADMAASFDGANWSRQQAMFDPSY